MSASVLVCGAVFDGVSEEPGGRTEILVRDGRIAQIGRSVDRPDGAEIIDLSERTVAPGFIDTTCTLRWMPPTWPSRRWSPRRPRR